MAGSFESVRWNACVHRLDLGLYSHAKEFWWNEVRTRVNSKGNKIPSTGSSEEDRTCDAASRYRVSYSGPPTEGQSHTKVRKRRMFDLKIS